MPRKKFVFLFHISSTLYRTYIRSYDVTQNILLASKHDMCQTNFSLQVVALILTNAQNGLALRLKLKCQHFRNNLITFTYLRTHTHLLPLLNSSLSVTCPYYLPPCLIKMCEIKLFSLVSVRIPKATCWK